MNLIDCRQEMPIGSSSLSRVGIPMEEHQIYCTSKYRAKTGSFTAELRGTQCTLNIGMSYEMENHML
jgi:hypothetical protein